MSDQENSTDEQTSQSSTRAGYVALVGRPNAGKSTLLNYLIGQKIAIVSDKPQTTRQRVLGVHTSGDSQMAFVDTPGIHRPSYRLNERMMDVVYEALRGVDVVVQLVDASQKFGKGEAFASDLVTRSEQPSILALNKVDLVNKARLLPIIQLYAERGDYDEIVPISAASGENVDRLLEVISARLPASEFLYDPDQFTDQTERALVSEIIREKVLQTTRQELPYSTAVQIEVFDESRRKEDFIHIVASIIVEKSGQKKIVVGRAGRMIREIGTAARKELQELLEVEKMFLELNVKVVPDWRNTDHLLDEYGVTRSS